MPIGGVRFGEWPGERHARLPSSELREDEKALDVRPFDMAATRLRAWKQAGQSPVN